MAVKIDTPIRFSTEKRLEIYRECLRLLERYKVTREYYGYLCLIFRRIIWDRFGADVRFQIIPTDHEDNVGHHYILDVFPEIVPPKDDYISGYSWFPPHDYQSRITILKNAINTLKTNLQSLAQEIIES